MTESTRQIAHEVGPSAAAGDSLLARPPIRILVLEPHQASALGFFFVLSRQPFVEKCVLAANRDEALELARLHRPELAIVELDVFTGYTVGLLRELRPSMRFVMSTRCEASERAARQLGASALLPVGAKAVEIVDAVRAAVEDGSATTRVSSETPSERQPFGLNKWERSVLALLVTGATNREIADELYLSLDSVKKYTTRIYRKLGVRNRVEVVRRINELAQADLRPSAPPEPPGPLTRRGADPQRRRS
jgi:DNA-binding NarL/FixJ family response regulator